MKVDLTKIKRSFPVQFGYGPSHKECINFDMCEGQYPSEMIVGRLEIDGIRPSMCTEQVGLFKEQQCVQVSSSD